MQHSTRAGWYPDPSNPEQRRYWDGSAWTERVDRAETPPTDAVVTELRANRDELERIVKSVDRTASYVRAMVLLVLVGLGGTLVAVLSNYNA